MPELEDSLVVFYTPRLKARVGVGILIRRDLVLTCAHVVNLASGGNLHDTGRPEVQISLRLHSLRSFECTARVAENDQAWSAPPASRTDGADLCLLHLSPNAPSNISPATLWVRDDLIGRKFRAVGFPDDYGGEMDVARGEIVGRDENGLYLLQPPSEALPVVAMIAKGNLWRGEHRVAGQIYTGFSGASVEVEGRIVGLIAESVRPSAATAYMIPVRSFPSSISRQTYRTGKGILTIEQINDFSSQKDDLWSAIHLWSDRLPAEERYEEEDFINMVRKHLKGDFGRHRPSAYWKAYLLLAKYRAEVVGMLLGYNYDDLRSNFLYIPYLVARKPEKGGPNPDDISGKLVEKLAEIQGEKKAIGQAVRFLAEVDDPTETNDPGKQLERRARIKLFGIIAAFAEVQLRCLDYKFLQPKLNPRSNVSETHLRLLYGTEDPPAILSRLELLDIITWLYNQLYAANISEDPVKSQEYEAYLAELLKSAIAGLPDGVRLFELKEVYGFD